MKKLCTCALSLSLLASPVAFHAVENNYKELSSATESDFPAFITKEEVFSSENEKMLSLETQGIPSSSSNNLNLSEEKLITRFDELMTSTEREKTGVAKLSAEELHHLEEWLVSKWNEESDVVSDSSDVKGEIQLIYANFKEGRYFMLKDGSYWETVFSERKKAAHWLRNDEVTISRSGRLDLPYRLNNLRTGEVIVARQIDPKLPATLSMFR